MPDLPPPYTLSAQNIWGIGSASRKLEYIGFASPKPQIREEQVSKVIKSLGFEMTRPIVFVHVSGPFQTRPAMINLAIESVRRLDPLVQFVVSEGNPKGMSEPRRIGKSSWFYEWCPVRDELFALSDLLVLRGRPCCTFAGDPLWQAGSYRSYRKSWRAVGQFREACRAWSWSNGAS